MITKREFFEYALNKSIPEMGEASRAFLEGDEREAYRLFASYVREHLDAEKYFSIPYVARSIPKDKEQTVAAADRYASFRLGACGFYHQYESWNVDWTLNPTPNGYCEYPWQLSRFEMSTSLAEAYRFTGDEKYAKVFAYLIDSWIDQNPLPIVRADRRGSSYEHVGWRTLESGIRMTTTWQYPLHIFIKSPAFSDELIVKIYMSIWEHGFHLHHYGSSHNWLLSEMTGLFVLSTLTPFFRISAEWQKYAMDRMIGELDVQIYPEGFQYELTTGYHMVAISEFSRLVDVARVYGVEVPEKMMEKIHRMYENHVRLIEPDNCVPGLNDGDYFNYAPAMEKALVYFPDDEVFRFFATAGAEGKEPPFRSVALETVGISVMRTGWRKDDIWALFDSAHLGWGHQHEDKLSFDLYAYGKRMLEDSGNYDYDTSKMRSMVVSTRGHNTTMVDTYGQNRSAHLDRAMEERRVKERIPSDLFFNYGGEEYEVADGYYDDGYGPDAKVMMHQHRKIIFFKRGLSGSLPFFVICDHFSPADGQTHLYEALFLMQDAPFTCEGRTATSDLGDGVSLSLIGSVDPVVIRGAYEPRYLGWKKDTSVHGVDHEHFPIPAVLYTAKGTDVHFVTVAYPNKTEEMPIASVSASAAGEDPTFTITLKSGKSFTFREHDDAFLTRDRDGRICHD